MITKEALQFLEDLIANNNTEWMHANKKGMTTIKKTTIILSRPF